MLNDRRKHCSEIVVRKIPFEFSKDINPVWNPSKPEWSHMANGASLTMPYLEPFLIRTLREASKYVSDDLLQADISAFMAQEGQHFQTHNRYNTILKLNGYPELADIEAQMLEDYKRFDKKSLNWRLAYTAGFETMTVGITEWLIGERAYLFKGADSRVASFILWHMVEETEHKNVAFDAYQHIAGRYFLRVWGTLYATWHIAKFSRKTYIKMLKQDGLWNNKASRKRLLRMIFAFFTNAGPALLRSLVPGYHPSKVRDQKWVKRWMDSYKALPANQIPLVDTTDDDIFLQVSPK